ncbi:hypothetical protein ACVW16_007014 [Bradyrhizobium sp. USDA 4474]
MATLREVIVYIVRRRPGITDRQLTEAIYGSDGRHQQVNAECRNCSEIKRREGAVHIENYIREPAVAMAREGTNID